MTLRKLPYFLFLDSGLTRQDAEKLAELEWPTASAPPTPDDSPAATARVNGMRGIECAEAARREVRRDSLSVAPLGSSVRPPV
jgi:hypothetical protein